MTDRVGQQLGNYRLVRLLGRGGFAEVYLGEHLRLGTQAAIKILYTKLQDDDEEEFLKEARTVAHLIHPQIIRVFDFHVQDGTPFLVMDYATNGTLRQRHPRGVPLPLSTVVDYVKQVADALQYAHDERLIHRDIKPENMLVGRRNEILLSDFGIALLAQSSRLQSTQEVVGTAFYMSPEQLQGKPRFASDQYSLGIVAYEWLCGTRPFQGTFTEVASQHMFVPPLPLRERVPEIPPEVEQVVFTALAKEQHRRFGSVRAFANALEQAGQARNSTVDNASTQLSPQRDSVTLTSSPLIQTDIISNSPASAPMPPITRSTPPSITPPNVPPRQPPAPLDTSMARSSVPSKRPIGSSTPAQSDSIPQKFTDNPPQPPTSARQQRSYIFDICIVLAMSIILFVGVSPELPEISEVPYTASDVARYECYAEAFWEGGQGLDHLPYYQCAFLGDNGPVHQFSTLPQEYPFLSLSVFMLGLTVSRSFYQITFAVLMALVATGIYFLLKRYRSRGAAIAFALYLVLGCWATAEGRYDLVPSALTLGAVIFAAQSRWRGAFSLLAIATLLKFYPILLVPAFLVAQQMQYNGTWGSRKRWNAFGLYLGICAGVTLLSLLLNAQGTMSPFLYFLKRPIQVESLPGSLLWLGSFIGFPLNNNVSFQSFNFISSLSSPVSVVSFLAMVAGIIYVCWLQRRGKVDMYMASLLTLLVVLLTSKVFSSQYLMWVLPLAAYVGQLGKRWLFSWGSAALLTTIIFPFIASTYYFYTPEHYYPIIVIRNAILLAVTCVLLFQATRSQYSPASSG